jgi:hypothetical protein
MGRYPARVVVMVAAGGLHGVVREGVSACRKILLLKVSAELLPVVEVAGG